MMFDNFFNELCDVRYLHIMFDMTLDSFCRLVFFILSFAVSYTFLFLCRLLCMYAHTCHALFLMSCRLCFPCIYHALAAQVRG